MNVRFHCPHCDAAVETVAHLTSFEMPCTSCGQPVKVPSSGLYPGLVLNELRIEASLGRGSMGEVYLATQLALDRKVALKVLSSSFTGNPQAVERFLKEVRLLAKLSHPNIVTAYNAGNVDGLYYLAMTYVSGETMAARLRRKGRLSEEDALCVVLCVARALKHAWDKHHLLHRDIKPANIMVDEDGEIKLMDLGLSKSLLEEADATQTGMLLGTPHYMSPEQASGSSTVDYRTDIYALGATLYHMLGGAPPFRGTNIRDILEQHVGAHLPPLRERNPSVSPQTAELVEWMMAKRPSQRPDSWDALIVVVEQILQERFPAADPYGPLASDLVATRPPTPPPSAPAAPPRRRRRWRPALLVLVLLAVVGWLWLSRAPAAPDESGKGEEPAGVTLEAIPLVAQSMLKPGEDRVHLAARRLEEFFHRRAESSAPEEDDRPPPRARRALGAMQDLDRRAAPLIEQKNFGAAEALYRDYRGPFAGETERVRRAVADMLKREAEAAGAKPP